MRHINPVRVQHIKQARSVAADRKLGRILVGRQIFDFIFDDNLSAVKNRNARRSLLNLAHQMRRKKNRTAVLGKSMQNIAYPHDTVRIQTVNRLVKNKHLR